MTDENIAQTIRKNIYNRIFQEKLRLYKEKERIIDKKDESGSNLIMAKINELQAICNEGNEQHCEV